MEVKLEILLGLVAVRGDDEVGGDVPQADDEDGQTPGAGDQSSGVKEEVGSCEREDGTRG